MIDVAVGSKYINGRCLEYWKRFAKDNQILENNKKDIKKI